METIIGNAVPFSGLTLKQQKIKLYELNEECQSKMEMPQEYQNNLTDIAHKNIMITKDQMRLVISDEELFFKDDKELRHKLNKHKNEVLMLKQSWDNFFIDDTVLTVQYVLTFCGVKRILYQCNLFLI